VTSCCRPRSSSSPSLNLLDLGSRWNARWAPSLVAHVLMFSRIFLTWDHGGIWFLIWHVDHLGLFSYLIPAKHRFTKTRGTLSV
jgi:hypothetical protein